MTPREKLHAAKERLRAGVIAGLDESGITDEYRRSAALDVMLAELRWCDAERRLALRALAEYAPACDDCAREVMERVRSDRDMHLATNELRGRVYCDEHLHADRPLVYAAQIAAADEEAER